MSLFQNKILNKYFAANSDKIKQAYPLYTAYFHNADIQKNIRESKEEQFQEGFLRELFVKVLGYTLNPDPDYNLITEKKNETNSKKADAAILVNGEVVGVVELKDTKTTDLKTVEAQAFGYKNYNRNASYVVISNFEKLRFYIDNAVEFIEFNLFTLSLDDFSLLWLCLAHENIAKGLPKQLKNESLNNEDQITKELYKDYSRFKRELFADLVNQNTQYDKLLLFKKSQKLLDRLLFIFFAEDRNLLPPNSMAEIINQWEKLKELDEYRPLYDRFKKYFGYMNTGFKGKMHDIFAYNGGLFKPDEVLDTITISDEVLRENSLRLSRYDFESEVDVNILGHIFENSLTEIEDIKVAIYDDMVEITSPGLLPPSIDYNAMESRQSDARNKIIAPVFKRMGIIDQWGNGLKLIADELKDYPNIELRWKEVGLSFQVQFVKLDYVAEQGYPENAQKHPETSRKHPENIQKTESIREQILSEIKKNPTVTRKELISLLNSTEGSVKHHLAKLTQEGVIKREGSDRAGKWIVIEEGGLS